LPAKRRLQPVRRCPPPSLQRLYRRVSRSPSPGRGAAIALPRLGPAGQLVADLGRAHSFAALRAKHERLPEAGTLLDAAQTSKIIPEKANICKARAVDPTFSKAFALLAVTLFLRLGRRILRMKSVVFGDGSYSTSSKFLNIGRYMAITMPPTTTIIRGSIIEVSVFTVASTSDL
jgi:hypothetical protein